MTMQSLSSLITHTPPSMPTQIQVAQGGMQLVDKPYATLKDGVWRFAKGWHRRGQPGGHKALRQPENCPFTVIRDAAKGRDSYEESGYFAINLHRGGEWSTSS